MTELQWGKFFIALSFSAILYIIGKIFERYNIEEAPGLRRLKGGAKLVFIMSIIYLILGLLGLVDFLDNLS